MPHPILLVRRVLVVTVALVSSVAARGAEDLRLTLPPAVYAVVGVPMSIYYDNIVLTETPEQYAFEVQCKIGQGEQRRWSVTPTADDVGEHRVSVTVRSQKRVLAKGQTVLRVAPADAGAGREIRLLVIGDSLTAATAYPNQIMTRARKAGNPKLCMLGTHRPTSAAEGVAHEGYGGWTWNSFVSRYNPKSDGTPKTKGSPFVFAGADGTPTLDLPRYFQQSCAGQRPDFVTVMLGINDCFSADPKNPDPRIDSMFQEAAKLITAMRRAAPEAEMGLCLTTPPNARQSGFDANYKGKYNRWPWKQIQHRIVQRQLQGFAQSRDDHLHVVPTELNLDPLDGYPENNGVHPNVVGYQQIGDSIYAWLKWRLAQKR